MMWQETPYTIPLILVSTITFLLGSYIWWRFRRSWAIVGALLILASAEWMFGYALELGSASLPAKLFWNKVQGIGVVIIPTTWMLYMLHYTGHEKWLNHRILVLLSIVPFTTLLLVFTNEYHGLVWSSVTLITGSPFSALHRTYGVWFWFFVAHSYVLILIGVFALVQMLIRSRYLFRWQTGALLVGSFLPLIGNMLDVSGLNPFPYLNLTPLSFPVTSLTVAFSLFYLRLGDIVPVAREAIIEDMGDSIIVLDSENHIMDLNSAAQQLIGYPTSKVMGTPIEEAWPSWPDQIGLLGNDQAEKEIVIDLNGQHTYDVKISPLTDWRGSLVSQIVVLRDITERQQAEKKLHESEEKFRTIFKHANDEIIYMDKNGTIIDINKKDTLFGYSPEEVIGKNFIELSFTGLDVAEMSTLYQDLVIHGSLMPVTLMELEFKNKKGDKVFAEVSTRVIKKNGEVEGILSIVRDVTERKKSEEKIKVSLKEKEVLLREIHHRVKNNLQVVSSLLSLQSRYMRDNQYTEMIKESQNRIKTMALIHEKLYRSDNLAEIDFNEYIKTLVYRLVRSYDVTPGHITLKIEVDNIPLGVDTAIPCGLIINELVSNCLKHAFPHRKGEITVSFYARCGMAELIVADNGVGIPDDIDFKNTETLGLQLVRILAEDQLEGEIILDRTKGTTFHITFER